MKYFSDITNKTYDTIEQLQKAESTFKEAQKDKDLQKQDTKEQGVATKKQLAKKVEETTKELNAVLDNYDIAKKKAQKIMDAATKEAKEILSKARDEVNVAEDARWKAISEFNKQYGVYTVALTGQTASQEYKRALQRAEDVFNSVFGNFWF